ncbi:X motif 8 [Seminavis robusta]|uniref:X motif 8 n=1 Tax=Seminavis robusta TaxID=568900 RepID=A0A9N8DYY4_9STRA|nr:X motif 8 [Seminavis robusta]|eukprot:Sro487_g152870.1 X motif 8 (437) ;mRNA; r:29779-31089
MMLQRLSNLGRNTAVISRLYGLRGAVRSSTIVINTTTTKPPRSSYTYQPVHYFSSTSHNTLVDGDDDDDDELEEDGAETDLEEQAQNLDYSEDEFPRPLPPKVSSTGNKTASTQDNTMHSTISFEPPEPVQIPQDVMDRIEKQEWQGGRMRAAQHGVLHEDPKIDMRLLMENYSVASLASALRDREDVLQQCALLAEAGDYQELEKVLTNFHPRYVLQRRKQRRRLDVCRHLDAGSLEVIRKALMRMPRTVTTAHTQRAGVVIPLCLVNGVPSLLLEKRSPHLRAHPDEVCLPGGMVCSIHDTTIVSTCLREMKEEIPGLDMSIVQVLGILRCNWGEVHHLVGVAVTPVVCYLGEVPDNPQTNTDEVAKVFTIPLSKLLENSLWVQKEDLAPIFVGGPEIIWGLTGYILERFVKDIVLPNHIRKDHHLHHHSLKTV